MYWLAQCSKVGVTLTSLHRRLRAPFIERIDATTNLLEDRIGRLPGLLQAHIRVTAQAHVAAFAVRRSESQDPGGRAALADIQD